MKRTIEDLWNGAVKPAESCGVGTPEIEKLVMLMERNREVLDRELGEKQKVALKKYIDCSDEYSYMISLQAFRDGFCLAVQLMAEALV